MPLGWEAEGMHGTDGASLDAPSVGKGSVAPVVLGQALPGLLLGQIIHTEQHLCIYRGWEMTANNIAG